MRIRRFRQQKTTHMHYRIILVLAMILTCALNTQAQSKKKKKKNKNIECTITVPTTMVWDSRDGLLIQSKCNLVKIEFKIFNPTGIVIFKADKAIMVEPGFYKLKYIYADSAITDMPNIETGLHVWKANYTIRGAETLEEKSATGKLTLIK